MSALVDAGEETAACFATAALSSAAHPRIGLSVDLWSCPSDRLGHWRLHGVIGGTAMRRAILAALALCSLSELVEVGGNGLATLDIVSVASDIAGAGTALAGLILVYL
jgi:hypothetical protein